MRSRSGSILLVLAASLAAPGCGDSQGAPADVDAGADTGPRDDGGVDASDPSAGTGKKVDILLVVDDSATMSDKSSLLASSLETLLRRLTPLHDVHLGVVSSSLGSLGGDLCSGESQDRRAHLRTQGPAGAPVPGAETTGFLAFGTGENATTDQGAFVRDAEALVRGVGEEGCGFEAQLESAYRFLVQPDPWERVERSESNQAEYVGTDSVLLAQRKAFLRPDSLVVVLLLTDEDDSIADPRSVGGQGWAFMARQFPGSTVFRADGQTTTAPRATSACAGDPASAQCTSCGFAASCNPADASCQALKSDPACQTNGGYYGPTEDELNVRFHRMKERYGVDPQFPISRYVDGFTNPKVPDRDGEHDVAGRYVGEAGCTNPLFAKDLPAKASDELCDRDPGPRTRDDVIFALVGGVPGKLLTPAPDWSAILGADPAAFDYTGIDPHMIATTKPRPGLPPPSATAGDNGPDPVHGREWNTQDRDLQYACTFALPAARACSGAACECGGEGNPPLCNAAGEQTRAHAYPSLRPLQVAKELGDRALVGSVCPADTSAGYRPFMAALADKLAPRLQQ
jgi:hypothetical protein